MLLNTASSRKKRRLNSSCLWGDYIKPAACCAFVLILYGLETSWYISFAVVMQRYSHNWSTSLLCIIDAVLCFQYFQYAQPHMLTAILAAGQGSLAFQPVSFNWPCCMLCYVLGFNACFISTRLREV